MFTGIVEEVGSIRAIERHEHVARVEIEARVTLDGVDLGGSVAVNGVCLTVIERRPSGFVFEIGPETLSRTALGRAAPGDPVNLERPLRFGGALSAAARAELLEEQAASWERCCEAPAPGLGSLSLVGARRRSRVRHAPDRR